MVLKAYCFWALFLLLCLPATSFFVCSEVSSYRHFFRRHVDNPKTDLQNDHNYCNRMMRHKGLKCQRSNTFIHASSKQLIAICSSGGKKLDGNQTSKTLFPITICIKSNHRRTIFCKYQGRSEIRKIRVTCSKGLPIHYITHT
ncbi:ribonuclease-like [Crotalus adamanteus]|uniref:Ribonuclease-like n=1 Tax=Crotalus adamanteus TaxID=8729 RepID=A0AAW1B841_CROAD